MSSTQPRFMPAAPAASHNTASHNAASCNTPPNRWARRGAFAVGTLGVSLGLSFGFGAAPALAHDTLIGSTPEAGAVVTEPLEEIVLEFSGGGLTTGAAINNDLVVTDSEAENWTTEEPAEVTGATMRADLTEPLPDGEYQVTYRVVYSDGHDEESSFDFTVELEDEAPTEEPTHDDAEPAPSQEAPSDEPSESELMPAPSPTADAEDAVSSGLSTSTIVLLSVGGLAVIGLAAVLLFRRRHSSGGQD